MITLENDHFTAQINPDGAELTQITRKSDGRQYLLNDPEHKYWDRHAPVLFPAIGRSNDEQYLLDGKTYPMTQHGFARDYPFEVIEQIGTTKVTLVQHATAETLEKFPFNYTLVVTFTLTESGLVTEFRVTNDSHTKMPFAIGHHPAFALFEPMTDYQLELENVEMPIQKFGINPAPFRDGTVVMFDEAKGSQIPLSHPLLDDGLIIIDTPEATAATLKANDGSHTVKLTLTDFPFVTIWSPEHKEAPFICVEPFAGLPDVAGEPIDWFAKEGNNILNPNATKRFAYEMTLD